MKWKLIFESEKTPSDLESIDASFNKDVSDEKYVPTVDFMKAVYNKMNKELFFNFLPNESEIKFMVRNLKNRDIGSAPYSKSVERHEITPLAIVFNNTYRLTLHGWMEAMLHEMIHVSDYLLNPDRFYDDEYEPHGDWFMKQGRRFKKHGFNVTKYCDLDVETNHDRGEEEHMADGKKNTFLVFNKDKENLCVRIDEKDKNTAMEFLSKQGVKRSFLLSTRNPFSEEVDVWNPDEPMSPIDFNDTTITLYGPFKRVELLDMSNPISESEEDELDKYMKIARKIKGVTKVYRKGDEVIVWLS